MTNYGVTLRDVSSVERRASSGRLHRLVSGCCSRRAKLSISYESVLSGTNTSVGRPNVFTGVTTGLRATVGVTIGSSRSRTTGLLARNYGVNVRAVDNDLGRCHSTSSGDITVTRELEALRRGVIKSLRPLLWGVWGGNYYASLMRRPFVHDYRTSYLGGLAGCVIY